MYSNPRAARALVEFVGPGLFLSIVRCGDGSYHEVADNTPRAAALAAQNLCARLGYFLTHVEIPQECIRAGAGGELRRMIALQRETRRVARRIEQIRRKHRRTMPVTMEGAA